ncbi:hypothetical protein K0A97_03485, partial [Patescibacteria group bacterium]|nr:hypothetical protein [Patescibacteria group bacterium]
GGRGKNQKEKRKMKLLKRKRERLSKEKNKKEKEGENKKAQKKEMKDIDTKAKSIGVKKFKKSESERKFDRLIEIGSLEELNYLVSVLSPKEIDKFIDHYKQMKHSGNIENKKTYKVVTGSKDYRGLIKNLKSGLGEDLSKEYELLKGEISGLRKRGEDVLIEDLKLTSVPFKIKLFLATADKKDLYKVKKIFEDVKADLEKNKIEMSKKEEEIKKRLKEKEEDKRKEETASQDIIIKKEKGFAKKGISKDKESKKKLSALSSPTFSKKKNPKKKNNQKD